MTANGTHRLVVTIDAEAQPARTGRSAVEHLIHGEAGAGGYGLWRILDIADRYGAVLTVFLDYAERDLWGESVLDVAREVRRRGHDLQLHLHPEFLSPQRFEAAGLEPIGRVARMSDAHAQLAADTILSLHDEAGGGEPLAFRGGGYHVNDSLLRALRHGGVVIDSSYVPARHAEIVGDHGYRPFRWTNGVAELPVGGVPRFRNIDYPKPYNFNATYLLREGAPGRDADDAARRHEEVAQAFWREQGADAPLVLVMHSWSLLQRGEGSEFGDGSEFAAEVLDRVLADAVARGAVTPVAGMAPELKNGALRTVSLTGTT